MFYFKWYGFEPKWVFDLMPSFCYILWASAWFSSDDRAKSECNSSSFIVQRIQTSDERVYWDEKGFRVMKKNLNHLKFGWIRHIVQRKAMRWKGFWCDESFFNHLILRRLSALCNERYWDERLSIPQMENWISDMWSISVRAKCSKPFGALAMSSKMENQDSVSPKGNRIHKLLVAKRWASPFTVTPVCRSVNILKFGQLERNLRSLEIRTRFGHLLRAEGLPSVDFQIPWIRTSRTML